MFTHVGEFDFTNLSSAKECCGFILLPSFYGSGISRKGPEVVDTGHISSCQLEFNEKSLIMSHLNPPTARSTGTQVA